MQHLIKAFEDIFQESKQLPPTREIDHCITLNEGTKPINVRPYMSIFKKLKLKKIHDMLKVRLIRSNTSFFSSPI